MTGRVVDEGGAGIAGAEVSAIPARGGDAGTESGRGTIAGPGGVYRIEVRPGVECRIRAAAKGCRAAESEVVMPGDSVPDLVLAPEAAPAPAPR